MNENTNILLNLETIYKRAISCTNLKPFLLSLYEYIEVFDKTPALEPAYKAIIDIAKQENGHMVFA